MNQRIVGWRSVVGRSVVALLPVSLLFGCVQDSVEPLSVPLHYQMMASPAEIPRLSACAVVSKVVAIDSRDELDLGERANQGRDDSSVPVTTASNVAQWVLNGAEDTMRASGVVLGRSGGPVLRVVVERVRTFENVYRRAGYEASVRLSAVIVEGDGETVRWRGHANGNAGNYGYAGSAENYQETLNHALDRAMISLMESPGFRDALCEKREGESGGRPGI